MDGASRSIKCVCCDCNSSCHVRTVRENRLKAKRATEITKQWNTVLKTGLPSGQYHPTFWSTELARTWKEPKDGWNLWCNFFVCESCPHQQQRLLVHNGHSLTQWEKSNLTPRNMPCSYINHMWLGQFYDIFPILQTSRGFTIQCLSSKTSATFTNMEFPPSVTIVFVEELFSGRKAISGKASNSSEVCACDSTSQGRSSSHISEYSHKSRLKGLYSSYFGVALQRYHACRSWFSICPKSHPESLAPLVCISGTSSSMTSEELDPNQAAGAIGLDRS